MKTAFDSDVLTLLVCPLSKAELVLYENQLVSTDKSTRRAYAIVDGIPDMLIAHSSELGVQEWERVMQAHID